MSPISPKSNNEMPSLITSMLGRRDSMISVDTFQSIELSPRFQTELYQQEIIFGEQYESDDILEAMQENDISENALRNVYNSIPKTDDNMITLENVKESLKLLDISCSHDDFWIYYTYVDKEMVGRINYQQFIELVLRLKYKICSLPEYYYLEDSSQIQMISYNHNYIKSQPNVLNIQDILFLEQPDCNMYINIVEITTVIAQRLAIRYRLDPLIVEDILQDYPRTKIDILPNYIYVIIPAFRKIENNSYYTSLAVTHLDILLVNNIYNPNVLNWNIYEANRGLYDDVNTAINKKYNVIKENKALYLLYSIMDRYVDSYNDILSSIISDLELMDIYIMNKEKKFNYTHLRALEFTLKNLKIEIEPMIKTIDQLMTLTKPVDSIGNQINSDDFNSENIWYLFRDLQDHLNQILSLIDDEVGETQALDEQCTALREQKINKMLNLLTIIQSVFLPIQFLTAVYGMNFDNFPEIHVEHGLYWWWLVTGILFFGVIGIVVYLLKPNNKQSISHF
ncbi:hypothetical protein WA158_004105 [Blastocystis sp. Blastoise]